MKQRSKRWIGIVLAAVVIVVLIARFLSSKETTKRRAVSAVPVEVADARIATVPIYLHALGTLVAYRTVTVEPMVTGPLKRVYFHEGQTVHKGELLAEIDPRPYEAALAQAQAKLAADRAVAASDKL